MKDFIERFICKNIIKILTIYRDSIEHNGLDFKNYLDDKIYFEIIFLIRLIKERNDEKDENNYKPTYEMQD